MGVIPLDYFNRRLVRGFSERVQAGIRPVPVWHPMFWFGKRWREFNYDAYSIGREYDGVWLYYTHDEYAKIALWEAAGCPTRP